MMMMGMISDVMGVDALSVCLSGLLVGWLVLLYVISSDGVGIIM